jgi:hypothetical protein
LQRKEEAALEGGEGLEIGTANLVSYTKEQGKPNVVYVLRKKIKLKKKERTQ